MAAKFKASTVKKLPTLRRYIRVDQISFFIVINIVCFLVTSAYLFFEKYSEALVYSGGRLLHTDIVVLLLPFIGLPIVLWRYRRLVNLFERGVMLTAQIIQAEDHLVPWYFVRYEFSYEGTVHRKTQVFMYTRRADEIASAGSIKILFDPKAKRSSAIGVFEF